MTKETSQKAINLAKVGCNGLIGLLKEGHTLSPSEQLQVLTDFKLCLECLEYYHQKAHDAWEIVQEHEEW